MTYKYIVDVKEVCQLRAQCLIALMSNPTIVKWVEKSQSKPASGGAIKIWTDLAKDYVEKLIET